ncbi:MAG: glycosyltransferase family 9 protein [Terrimicrobiaceae bacterium]
MPHRKSGLTCTCGELIPVKRRGVIIKLGAAGDVLRTTPLLRALDPVATGTKVLWVTHSPELLPKEICEAVKPDAATLARLSASEWDFCWNLDKDIEACALASHVRTTERAGYTLRDGVPFPVDERAWHKFATGLDNPYSQANRLNYVQEIFDIVGLAYQRQEYWLRSPSARSQATAEQLLPGSSWIGLNTGAGWRWPTRIWSGAHWSALVDLLKAEGLKPVILGGPEEVEMNDRLAAQTGCFWPGVQSLDVFYAMIHRCSSLVTSVTQAMHLAIAAKTPLVLFNNIFNAHEFELYGRGEIVGPPTPCDCFYDASCRTGRNCINEITPRTALVAVQNAIRCKRS